VGFTRFGSTKNLLDEFGFTSEDLRVFPHLFSVWVEFRKKVPAGRYELWIACNSSPTWFEDDGPAGLLDSRVADRGFSYPPYWEQAIEYHEDYLEAFGPARKIDSRESLRKEIDRLCQFDVPCVLCGRLTRTKGVFIPENPEAFGYWGSGRRAIVYALCEEHDPKDRTVFDRVEDIFSELYGEIT